MRPEPAGKTAAATAGWLAAGILLFAIGAKLALVHYYGGDQPYADQWAAEGATLFRARLYNRLGWENFFMAHGEHRPALTRGLAYGLFLLDDRQWDNRVELVANLLIYAACLWLVWSLATRLVSGRWQLPAALGAAALFALPANRENFLWGFQSQFLFLILAGLVHIGGTLRTSHLGWRWAGAQLAGLAGLFSIASGSISALVLVGLAAGRLLRGRSTAWNWATLAVNVGLVALGFWLLPGAAYQSTSRAPSVGHLLSAVGYLLAWPLPGPWWALAAYLPWVLAAGRALWTKTSEPASAQLVAAGAWVIGLLLAIAYGRGAHPDAVAVRYYDIAVLGVLLNGLALVRFVAAADGRRRLLIGALAAGWVVMMAGPLVRMNQPSTVGPLLSGHRAAADQQALAIAQLLKTRDPAALSADPAILGRFPHLQLTVDLLLDPGMRPWLAPSLTADGRSGPLSRLAPRLAAGWWLLSGAGMLSLAIGAWRLWLRPPSAPRQGGLRSV